MHKAITAALALMLSCAGAPAQVAPQQPQDVVAPTSKLNLTLEQRHTIREFAKDMKADAADAKAEVGEPIPQGITPRPLDRGPRYLALPRYRLASITWMPLLPFTTCVTRTSAARLASE